MKNKPSKKHHYLPRFYLRGFTNTDNSFFVYDKQEDRIFVSNPDNTFFKKNLNTVTFPKGHKSIFIEEMYTNIENRCWSALDRIRNSNPLISINHEDKEFLFLFILFLYWRLPTNIPLVEKLSETAFTKENSIDYFKIKTKSGNSIPEGVVEKIRNTDGFKKSFRLILPFAPFLKDKNWGDKLIDWKFLYTRDSSPFYIVGDNPIIIKNNINDPINLLDEFIFPVSGNVLLINNKPITIKELPPEFIIQYGAVMIQNASRFVVCPNKSFLECLVKYYKTYVSYGNTDIILDEMFKFLK